MTTPQAAVEVVGSGGQGTVQINSGDDTGVGFGSGSPAQIVWDTTDPNANALYAELPAGGAVDVPVLLAGIGIAGVDLGLFNGLTQPFIGAVDADRDSYVGLHFSGDDVPIVRMFVAGGTIRNHVIPDVASSTFAVIGAAHTWTGTQTFGTATVVLQGSGNSNSVFDIQIPGTGDGLISFTGAGTPVDWSIGVDNSDGDTFKIAASATLESSTLVRFTNDGTIWAFQQATSITTAAGDLTLNPSGDVDLSSNALNSVGASGNDWTAAKITHKGGTQSKLERTSANTDALTTALEIQATTPDDNMTDGFGTGLLFRIEDNGAANQIIGLLAFRRAGADNTGDFLVQTTITGTNNEAFKVSSVGVGSFDLAGSGSDAQTDLFDTYDDPVELQRFAYSMPGIERLRPGITEEVRLANRERMLGMGILERVPEASSGYHLKIQPFMNLLAGGVYQNRARMDAQYEQIDKRLQAIGA